jgi:hypothetical protein
MKACPWCGREQTDDAQACSECGAELSSKAQPTPRPQASQTRQSLSQKLNQWFQRKPPKQPVEIVADTPVDFLQIPMGFKFSEGFSRPNWQEITDFVRREIPEKDWPAAWDSVARRWLAQLKGESQGKSQVYTSEHFFCLSDLGFDATRRLMDHAEFGLDLLHKNLGNAAFTNFHGKHVLLLFSDLDTYFAYISHFYPEGNHALSLGSFLRGGYSHIALPNSGSIERALTHELAHNLLCHLPLPTWLNEGLAVALEARLERNAFQLDQDAVDRHASHWNEQNIQTFWSGESFSAAGEASGLSYSLAQILVALLVEKGADLGAFVAQANYRDAGQAAAMAVLHCDLGDLVAEFLGPGQWRPVPPAASSG